MATKTYEELVELLQDGKIGHLHFVLQGENAQDFWTGAGRTAQTLRTNRRSFTSSRRKST